MIMTMSGITIMALVWMSDGRNLVMPVWVYQSESQNHKQN